MAVDLEKKIAAEAPRLIDLSKKLTVSLEKKNLSDETCQVALVLDASRSMLQQYLRGDVQDLLDRVIPLAVKFDDDGQLDVWRFSDGPTKLETVTLKNLDGYIERHFTNGNIKGGNNEPAVMNEVIDHFRGSKLPVYVVFISDGGVNRSKQIAKVTTEASSLPMFWQFMGLGGKNYGILEKLDTMDGRVVDNANFFALDDIHSVEADELYDRLLNEFPDWLGEARREGIITPGGVDWTRKGPEMKIAPKQSQKKKPFKQQAKKQAEPVSIWRRLFPFLFGG